MGKGRAKKPWGGPLTLEKYHRFFVDPWSARLTIDNLNHILSMHGFVKLYRDNKVFFYPSLITFSLFALSLASAAVCVTGWSSSCCCEEQKEILNHLVGQVDLQPPRCSTLHTAARPSAAGSIAAAQAAADVDAIGWTECPIGAVAAFAGFGEDLPEPLEPIPPPADHALALALAVRRPRSKRTRGSAYPRRVAPEKANVKEEHVEVEEEEGDIWQPPPSPPPMWMSSPTLSPPSMSMSSPTPSPPPMWMRSPTPPPPPTSPPRPQTVVPPPPSSPPRPQTVVPPPPSSPSWAQPKLEPILSQSPGFSSSPPPGFSSPPPPGFGSPPPPGFGSPAPPCWSRPTLAPFPTPSQGFVSPPPPCWNEPILGPIPAPPPGFGSPHVTPPPQLSWGLPLPMVPPPSVPGAPPTFTHHLQPEGPPPLWRRTVPPYYPATCWGAPSVLPPQEAPWRWPHPPPRWAPPHMMQQQRPPPPWGCMMPSEPPPMPPQHLPRFVEQQHTSQPSWPGVSWTRPRPVF
ncbi:unnamed protein product [Alopecurus aequalis]